MTLEQLAVVSAPQITFDSPSSSLGSNGRRSITVEFTPTVPHCGMSTFIGAFICPLHQKESNSPFNCLLVPAYLTRLTSRYVPPCTPFAFLLHPCPCIARRFGSYSRYFGTAPQWQTQRAGPPGLSIRVRLLRSLPNRFKVDIRVKPGSHQSEHARECSLPYRMTFLRYPCIPAPIGFSKPCPFQTVHSP